MKKSWKLALGAAMALTLVTGCSTGSEDSGKQKLVVSTWGLSQDVWEQEVKIPFEEKYNCELVLDTGGTNDRYTKLANNPNSEVDIIELSQSAAANGYEAGLFEQIDYSKISNASSLIEPAAELAENGFGAAYTVNSIGIIYNPDEVGFEINDWSDLWNEELKGKISIPDISTTFGPAMVYVANDYANGDIKEDQGEAAFKALAELQPNIVKTYSKSSDLANMFASGEIAVAVVGDFGIPTIEQAQPNVKFVVPASGTYANFNTIDINKNSKNKELAYEYVNFRLSQELQSSTAITLNEAPTNKDVVLVEETALNKTYGEVAANAKTIDYSFVNPLLNNWIDQWNRIVNR
ncbi:MAG: ABC transporter substrate-binding protein [Turicibacter sanguinis]|uniref:ABC transporter substrate-binding protein n=1 Tax=Turicibacter sanguinis TaxID=154288 RepID=UPI002F927021